jgi:hypothetical protein
MSNDRVSNFTAAEIPKYRRSNHRGTNTFKIWKACKLGGWKACAQSAPNKPPHFTGH